MGQRNGSYEALTVSGKMKHRIPIYPLLPVLLAVLLFCLISCGGKPEQPDGKTEPETTDTKPQQEETTMDTSKKDYPADAELFDSFVDLRENAALFTDRAPCTVSTKGYYAPGDGGAAVYRIVREKPEGIFERLDGGIWAVLQAEKSVTPRQFGARGDGKTNDATALMRAAQYASAGGILLVLPEEEYYTAAPVTFGDITVRSENAKISYWGMETSTAAVYIESNTTVTGTLNIWSVDNRQYDSNHGERCALMFGRYATSTSVTHCNIENVVITGGTKHTNGVFITGDSYDITLGRVYVPDGTLVNRAVLIHWGNSGDYIVTRNPNTYTQKPGGKPTQHPHDIHIGTIECHGLKEFPGLNDGRSAAISICAGYDITVDEIIASDVCAAVNVSSADAGFYFASENEKDMTIRNLRFGKITATDIHEEALYVNGTATYVENVETWPEIYIGEFYAEASAEKPKLRGLNIHEVGRVGIGKLTLVGFGDRALSIAYGCRNVDIDELEVESSGGWILYAATKAGKGNNTDIRIGKLTVNGPAGTDSSAVYLSGTENFRLESVEIRNRTYATFLTLGSGLRQIRVDRIVSETRFSDAVIRAEAVITAENAVSLGEYPADVPLSVGKECNLRQEP